MSSDQQLVAAALPLYELEDELGRGAWGVVLAGRHRTLGREVAIKQLPRAFGADPAVRSRFVAEARLLASLEHSHIVPIYDFVEHEGLCLLVMERLTGGTVWSRSRAAAFGPQTACAVILAACSGLHYAHQRGVLHRDIKPENLMFSGKGVLKITDFGIAKVVGGAATVATRAGDVLGTPAYMAPEQAQGSELAPATDVYAAGTVLYELLSGRLPFAEDSNPVALLYRHVHEQPVPLAQVAPQVPGELAAVTALALERDPADRYQDAQQLAVAVAEAAAHAWGPGWLPGTGMTVTASGAVLSAALGQRGSGGGKTILPPRPDGEGPREVPARREVTPGDLVPVNLLQTDAAAAEPAAAAQPVAAAQPAAAAQPVAAQPAAGDSRATIDPPSASGGPAARAGEAAPPLQGRPPGGPSAPRRRVPPAAIAAAALVVVVALVVGAIALSSGGGKKAAPKATPAGDASLVAGDWRAVRNAPSPRQELASAVANGTVWVVGGLNGTAGTNKVEGYDPVNDNWSSGPDLPMVLHHTMAATYKGEVVVVGGWVPDGGNLTATTSDRAFALRGGKWVELPRLHHPRAAGAAAVADGRLVVFGGQTGGRLVAPTEVFDGNGWTDAPDLPTPRDHVAGASDGTFVYAVGGRQLSADRNVAALERYDPRNKRWERLPDLPTPRGDLGATVVAGRLLAVGGEGPTSVFGEVESFDLASRQWSADPAMRTPRHGIALATVGTSVYALDGSVIPSHSQSSTVAEVLPFTSPAKPSPEATGPGATGPAGGASPWQAVHEAPTARQELASTSDNGVIWVFGGLTATTSTPKVEGYDPAIDTWKSGPDLPLPLHHEMAVTFHGELVVMGGWVPQGGNLSAVTSNKVFALRNGAWVELPPLGRPRAAGAAAVVGDRIVVVGGQADGRLVSQTEMYDGTRWSDASDMPTPRDHLAAASDGQYVYAVGGRVLTADKNLATFERFDPASGHWARGPDLPTPRGGLAATFVSGQLVVAGGETPSSALDAVEAFELAAGKWKALPPLRTARHGLGLAAVGTSLYAIDGGRRPGHPDPSPTTEVLRL